MSKISLRLRITFLVGIILVLLVMVLTYVSIWNANRYFVTPLIPQLQSDLPMVDVTSDIQSLDITTPENSTFNLLTEDKKINENVSFEISVTELTAAQRGFSIESVYVLIAIIVLGLGITYWIMGRALKPLTVLSETIHDINEHNLSKVIEGNISKDEVGSIADSFNGMLGRLKGSFEQQKRFSASAAHELKTPLATMKTSLQVLKLDDSPNLDDYKEVVSVMEQNIERLIYTVNDLLLLSSEEKMELDDEISLHTLFYEIAEELEESIQGKNLCCRLPQNDCLVTGSHMLLRSAFYNLFENAVKYNRDGGTVEVDFQKMYDGKTSVSICDTGIGMSDEETEMIFEPFFRAERSCVQQISGNGLGMSIIRTIVERHGGEIRIESKIDIGTTITVIL